MRGREPLLVWLLFGLVTVEILVTYSRVPPAELYHVSRSGLTGGASRALVFLNFPTALVAIALIALVYERLPSRGLRSLAIAAVLLCTPVFWPGVVSQADLDARWENVPAAVGVALALGLTTSRRAGPTAHFGDRRRLVLGVLVLLAAPAWLAADLGFFLNGVPVLGSIFETGPYFVHHGHHHGMDGVLLVLASLLLSRALPAIRARPLRVVTAAYLALMLAYGIGNVANDFWLEQVVKRGWTNWAIPSVLEPRLTWAWAVLVAGATAIWITWFNDRRASVD
jgi:hypothetical protein